MTEPSEMAQMYFFSPDAFPAEGRQAIAFVSSAFAIDVFPAEGGNPDRSRVFPDQNGHKARNRAVLFPNGLNFLTQFVKNRRPHLRAADDVRHVLSLGQSVRQALLRGLFLLFREILGLERTHPQGVAVFPIAEELVLQFPLHLESELLINVDGLFVFTIRYSL